MPENEPNGTPAATDAAGQQPTNTNANTATTTTESEPNAQPAAGAEHGASQESVANPEAKRYADEAAKYRKELRDAQKRLQELEAKEQAAQDAQLSETERLKKKLAEYEQEIAKTKLTYRERVLNSEIRAAAREAGVNPALAARLVDLSEVEDDDEGNPSNIAALLKKAVKEYGIATQSAVTDAPAPTQPTNAQRAAAAGQAMGATNAARQSGPIPVTATQYLDKAFNQQFRLTHGMDVLTAVKQGKAQLI